MQAAEAECFAVVEQELRGHQVSGASCERRPVDPAIQQHPAYSPVHFTGRPARAGGLAAAEAYAGRANLLYFIPGTGAGRPGHSVALNGHLDVVPPYHPPSAEADLVFGRGACDDKGPVTAMLAALRVLSELMRETGLEWNRPVTALFVIDEETGGNGSLSLAVDKALRPLYESVMVCECTDLQIHPANRGAVWYRAEIESPAGVDALELVAAVVLGLEAEGAAIRAESRHPLFPLRPVQTCHGMLGPFGALPSRVCPEVALEMVWPGAGRADSRVRALLEDVLDAGLTAYTSLYGDKTKTLDPTTGKPLVGHHYDLKPTQAGFVIEVHGAAGHMGAVRDRDGAITKMAFLVRDLLRSRHRLETAAGGALRLQLAGHAGTGPLVLEGGQGFLPTHPIAEIMDRLRRAAGRGVASVCREHGVAGDPAKLVTVTYDRLHNAAFDGDPDSPMMRHALTAARACGIPLPEAVTGWSVSCDARLFATEHPGLPVITFGPGELRHAHSDQEQIRLDDIVRAAEFLALFLLRHTGTADV